MFQNRNLEKLNSFFFQNLLLIGEGQPFDISLFGLSKVDFQGLLGKIQAHVFKILIDIFGNELKGLVSLVGVNFLLFFLLFFITVFFYGKGGEGFFNLIIITNGAVDDAERSLFLKRAAVLEPAFEFVPVGTDKIKSYH